MIADETLWACTTCGYCEAACPIELEHLDKFFRMRQHQVMIAGEFPHELKHLFEAYEAEGNPWGLPAGERAALGRRPRRADRPRRRRHGRRSTASSTSARRCRSIRAARRSRAPSCASCSRPACASASSARAEGSTGECVRRVGNEVLFRQLATALSGTLGELGVKRIVTCDPHALNSLRNEYPEFGVRASRWCTTRS